jgi:2-iminobutanoate/2-iminopropanoate deaminase
MPKHVIRTDDASPPLGAYSQGWRAGDFIFVTGCGPIGADGKVKGETVAEQTDVVIDNLDEILRAGGATLDDVVKATVHLLDTSTFPEYDEVYGQRFSEPRPARTTVGSDLRQVPGMRVEIDVTAYVGD